MSSEAMKLQQRIAGLSAKFMQRAENDALELEGAVLRLFGNGEREAARETIRFIAHRLAGTAGLFGFASMSVAASQLEDSVVDTGEDRDIAARTAALVAAIRRAETIEDEFCIADAV